MASAFGSAASAARGRGTNVYDIRDYGAVPGQVCDQAFARALAAIAAHDTTNPGSTAAVLFIPGAPLPYYITRTLWITRSNLTIEGDGRDVSWVQAMPGYNAHMIVAGINTAVTGGVPTADHFPALTGFGDGTLAGCHGLRLKTDQIVAFWSGPLDQPMAYLQTINRGWSDFPQITISLSLDDRGVALPAGPLYGLGETGPHSYQARPFHLINRGDGWLEFRFTTAESPDSYRSCLIPEPAPSGALRMTIQLDLVNCTAQAYINKLQVNAYPFVNMGPTSSQARDLPFAPADHLRLVANAYHPFMLGGYGSNTQSRGGAPVMDLTVGGLAISRGLLYANDGVGTPQRALDGAPVTDSSLVRPPSGTLMGRLAIEDIAATNPLGGREIPVLTGGACGQGGGVTCGLMSSIDVNSNVNGWLSHLSFRNVSLRGSGWYGDLLCLGGAFDVAVEGMDFANGYCNLGSVRMGPSTYDVTLAHLRFGFSFGAGCFGHSWMADARNLRFLQPTRNALTLVASNFSLRHSLINASLNETTIACYAEDNGGNYRFEDITVDNEGNVTPTRATILVEVPWNQRNGLTIDGVSTGTTGPQAAVVELRTIAGIAPRHYPVTIRHLQSDHAAVMIRTDHPQVSGEIAADTPSDDFYPWLEFTGGITSTEMTIRSARYPVPPGRLSWTDTAVLEVRRPVLGLPARYRCVRAGAYGTATVPAWRGEAIQDDGTGTALGAFSTVSEVIAATVSGVPSIGGLYTDWARNTLLDYWLRGVAATPPAALTLGPSIWPYHPDDAGASWNPSVAVTGGFAAAASRGTTNTAAITFPVPTPYDLQDTQALLLLDPASRVIWQARLARGIPSARTDPVLTIAGGGIVVSGGAATGTPGGNQFDESTGGFTNYALNAETNFWHRGVALPATGGLELGLSTGLANREGTVTEPVGNGYARVAIGATDFAPAADGRSVLAVAKAFPAATGADWPPVQSVFLRAIGSGQVLWNPNLVTARTARAGGPPLRFAVGALVVVK
jgi:hypothetical protein